MAAAVVILRIPTPILGNPDKPSKELLQKELIEKIKKLINEIDYRISFRIIPATNKTDIPYLEAEKPQLKALIESVKKLENQCCDKEMFNIEKIKSEFDKYSERFREITKELNQIWLLREPR